MKFTKYSSIENSYREKEIESIYIAGFADKDIEWVVTEKVDGCFEKNQKVLTKNGYKKISKINENDFVLSFNHRNGKLEYKKVKKSINRKSNKRWIKLIFDNGKEIICTEDHKIFTKNRGYVEAKYLNENDEFIEVKI